MLKNTKEELREKEIILGLVSLLKKELKPEKILKAQRILSDFHFSKKGGVLNGWKKSKGQREKKG